MTERREPELKENTFTSRTFYLGAGLIFLVYLSLSLGDARTTAPWCDEAWLADPALTFLRHRYFGTPLLTPFGWGPPIYLPNIAHYTYWIMPLHMVMQVAWYQLFGFSLLSLRTLSIFWGAIALFAAGAIARSLAFDARVVLLAATVTATDYFFLTRASDGRMDMMAAALMLLALASYLWQRSQNITLAIALAGFFAAASFFTHPVGGFFAFCGLTVLVLRLDRHRVKLYHPVIFGMPFALMGAAWGAYALQDSIAWQAQLAGNAYGRWRGLLNPLWSIHEEIRLKYFQAFGLNDFSHLSLQHLRAGVLIAYLTAIVTLLFNRQSRKHGGVRTLLWIILVFMFAGLFFDGAKRDYYLTYLLPFFGLALAASVEVIGRFRRPLRFGLAVAFGLVVLIQLGGTIFRISQNEYSKEYLPVAQFVSAHNPEQRLVLGSGELGFYLGFPEYLKDDLSLGYFAGTKPKLIFSTKRLWGFWLKDLGDHDTKVGRYVTSTLNREYALVLDTKLYQVYERK